MFGSRPAWSAVCKLERQGQKVVLMEGMRTVFEAAGGHEGLRRLAGAWHRRVMSDEVVSHAFSHGFHPEHIERLAALSGRGARRTEHVFRFLR